MNHALAALYNPVLPDLLGGGLSGKAVQGGTAIGGLISGIVGLVLILAALLAFAYFLTGGVQWITSGGDKTAMESARNKITHALIGLIIVAAAFAIFSLVGQFFGFNQKGKDIELEIPTFDQSSSTTTHGVNSGEQQ